MAFPRPHPASRSQGGYSLIEVMVSSLLLGLAIIGVVSMLRTVRELEFGVHMNRKARIMAENVLESKSYKNYSATPPALLTYTEVLEPREANPINASVLVITSTPSYVTWQTRSVEYEVVHTTISWPNPFSASSNTLSLKKCVANLQ
jgi:hypothetical protein